VKLDDHSHVSSSYCSYHRRDPFVELYHIACCTSSNYHLFLSGLFYIAPFQYCWLVVLGSSSPHLAYKRFIFELDARCCFYVPID
jgi:hypothetical protein